MANAEDAIEIVLLLYGQNGNIVKDITGFQERSYLHGNKNGKFICADRTRCKRAGGKDLINMFYKQIILQRGLPFEVRLPIHQPVDMGGLDEVQLDAELEKGYIDMIEGRTRPAKDVFADIRQGYGL